MSRDLVHVLDILDAARLLQNFAQGVDRQAFDQDLMRQYAVVRCFEIIGEATRRLSESFREDHSEIPWRSMAGMRDRLIHRYDEVDLDLVWEVIQNDIPKLIAQVEPLVPPDEPEQGE